MDRAHQPFRQALLFLSVTCAFFFCFWSLVPCVFLLWVAGWDESHLRQIFFSLRRSLLVECWWRLKRRGLKCARLTALGQITSYEGRVSRMVGVPNLEKVRSKKDGDTQKVGPVYSPCSSYCYSSCFSCVSCCRCRLRLLLLLFLLFQILLSLLLVLLPQRLLLSLHELLLFLLLPLLLKYLMSVHVICIRETIAEVSAQEEGRRISSSVLAPLLEDDSFDVSLFQRSEYNVRPHS